MRSLRIALVAPLVLGLGLLASCSDDETSPEGDQDPSATTSEKGSGGAKTRNCKVDVTLSGALETSWQGKGQAVTKNSSGPPAFYQAAKGAFQISAYAEGEEFTPSVVVNTKDGTFTSQPGAEGLDIKANGKGAAVDADTVGVDAEAPGVHVIATFTC